MKNKSLNNRFKTIYRIVLVLMTLYLVCSFGLAVAIYVYGQQDRQQNADVIVVLAGSGNRESQAAELWHQGVAPFVLCNGGVVEGDLLAEICRQRLLALNVPDNAIFLEPYSLSTEEHAVYLLSLMQEHGWETVLIVSSDYHLFRSVMIFEQYGIEVYSSSATDPNRDNGQYLFSLAREVLAVEWQILKTIFNLPYTRID